MSHFSLEATLDRIKTHNDETDLTADIKGLVGAPKAPVVKPTPKDDKQDDENNNESDDEEDGDNDEEDGDNDEDDNEETDPGDSLKTFPSTAVTQPIYDRLQDFGNQAFVVAEILNQIEGFKGAKDTDNMNRAVAALQAAISDMNDMSNKCKNDITNYLKPMTGQK